MEQKEETGKITLISETYKQFFEENYSLGKFHTISSRMDDSAEFFNWVKKNIDLERRQKVEILGNILSASVDSPRNGPLDSDDPEIPIHREK